MPWLVDLFCGGGGAATGYARAGFEVVGVDSKPQPRYPFRFVHADAMEFPLDGFDAVHASPPCQGYSATRAIHGRGSYPMLVEPVRERLAAAGVPYVIENVPRAPLIDPLVLCGSQFGLTAVWGDNGRVALRRHRLFETNILVPDPGPHDHRMPVITVAGHSTPALINTPGKPRLAGRGYAEACREAMGIDWMIRDELSQAIPPAYTEYIGEYLIQAVNAVSLAA